MFLFPKDVDDIDPDIGYMEIKIESDTEVKPSEETLKEEPDTKSAKEKFEDKLEMIKLIMMAISGGVSISSRIDPVLMPKNWKTTSILTRGEIAMINSFIIFAKQSPEECICMLEYCINYASLKLSESGFGIEKAIDLGKALTQTSEASKLVSTPEKPTTGSKDKE